MPHDRSRQFHGLVGQVIPDINREFGVLTIVASGADVRNLRTTKERYLPYNQWTRKGVPRESNTAIYDNGSNTIVDKRPEEKGSRATETIRGYVRINNWKGGTRADRSGRRLLQRQRRKVKESKVAALQIETGGMMGKNDAAENQPRVTHFIPPC